MTSISLLIPSPWPGMQANDPKLPSQHAETIARFLQEKKVPDDVFKGKFTGFITKPKDFPKSWRAIIITTHQPLINALNSDQSHWKVEVGGRPEGTIHGEI